MILILSVVGILQCSNINETGFPNIHIGLYVVRVRAVLVWGVTCTIRPCELSPFEFFMALLTYLGVAV
jgi:hypothetical protein